MKLRSINPATGRVVASFEGLTDAALDAALDRAGAAFRTYRRTRPEERAGWLRAAAAILEDEKASWARLMTTEMGKTFKAAEAEAVKCGRACRHFAEHGAAWLADEEIRTESSRSFTRCLPLGPILAVMPWNFPFWQVVRFAAPALMAGNVGLLKHAPNVCGCSLALENIFRRAGFPMGVFQALLAGVAQTKRLVADPRVAAITLTGSGRAGSAVAELAGRHLKKSVLELGGSDPFIVMPSADLDEAVGVAVTARNQNNGQSCIAAKRFIVHETVYDVFERRFVEALERLKVGDPMEEDTDVGPLAKQSILRSVERQVAESVAAGARVLTGGARLKRNGWYYAVTALADIPREAPVFREEVFGPVALLFRVRNLDEAIALANATDFGLAASVWTRDAGEAARCIDEIEAGATFVNAMVASDPRLPFGGIKRSGYGRELGREGIREFVNLKTVLVR